MKIMKYTFRTPLSGSINCEELISEENGRIELSPEQMCRLYDTSEKLLMFLTENAEDLVAYVPEELKGVVLRAEFGDCAMIGGRMYLRTYIWVEEHLTDSGIEMIQEWITGQMSDGWGEGLEQREWMEKRVQKPCLYFDEYSLEFEEDTETCIASYYVHPWNADTFEIDLEDCEEVEEDAHFELVATLALPSHNRQVIKLSSHLGLRRFLKDFGQDDLISPIEESCWAPMPTCSVYVVRDLDKNTEILEKWAVCMNDSCTFYDHTQEGDNMTIYNMGLSKAVLDLLK